MSDQPEDQSGAVEDASEPETEPLEAWPESEQTPAWSKIVDDAESAAPGSAEPGAAPEEAPSEGQPEPETPPSRRPTSLRDQYVQDTEGVPRRKLEAPAFPGSPPVPGSKVTPPVSEATETGISGEVPHTSHLPHVPNPASLLGKLPKDKLPTDKISMDKLPLDKLSAGNLPVDRLRTLAKQRPEVGLGLAFAGGLVIATILKRLGRR